MAAIVLSPLSPQTSGGAAEGPAVGLLSGWGKGRGAAGSAIVHPPRANCSLNVLVVIAADATVPVSVAVAVNNPRVLLMRRFMANMLYVVGKLTAPTPPDVFVAHDGFSTNPPPDSRDSPSTHPGAATSPATPAISSPAEAGSAGPGPIVIVQVCQPVFESCSKRPCQV